MKKIIISILIVFTLTACSPQEKKYSFEEDNIIEKEELKGYVLKPNEQKAKGKSVKFGAQIFNISNEDDDFTYYQTYLDPINLDDSVLVLVDKTQERLQEEDIVLVEGVIVGEFTGTNAFGGNISSLAVRSENIEKSSFQDAILPSLKTINIDKQFNQNNFLLTLEKIEFSDKDTRVYIKAENKTDTKVSIYSSDGKIIADGKNYEEEYLFSASYPEIDTNLSPDTSTEGIISFPAINFNKLSELKFVMEKPYPDNWELKFEDYVWDLEL